MMENQQLLGTYTILEPIGSGSSGTVYKAYHNRLKQIVVMKQLHHSGNPAIDKRKEVDLLKNLRHSCLPQVLDFVEMDRDVYTVMSFIPGKSFHQLLADGKHFTRQELLRWALQICSALNYLHTQKIPIIHGDIKPSNIMLTPEGNVCLIDFNIAFYLDEDAVLGYTDGYASPEQYMAAVSPCRDGVSNSHVINEQSDIYSAGATLYHLAMGKKARNIETDWEFNQLVGILGEPFANVIRKAMAIEPKDRYESAIKMFQALKSIPKSDSRYRSMLLRQRLCASFLCLLLTGFIVLGAYGFSCMQDDQYEEYNALVDCQIASIDDREFQEANHYFENAKEVLPAEMEAYYQNARSLYLQGQYTDCQKFIENQILGNHRRKENRELLVDVYAIKGLVDMELGDAAGAVADYERAMRLGAFKNEYYRDYAIALARNGQEKKAKEILAHAEEYGLDDGSMHYTKGEIHVALGEEKKALSEFQTCIDTTDDDYMRMRAFVMESKLYEDLDEQEQNRGILLQAKERLPIQEQMVILERLVQADIDLAEETGQSSYRLEAIDVLNDIISNQWALYKDYDTMAILYQKELDLSQVAATLQTMAELFGNDYNICKRYAFLEAEQQNLLPQNQRDYTQFDTYYQQARTMYYKQLKDNNTDAEMILLDDIYEQVKSGGWL